MTNEELKITIITMANSVNERYLKDNNKLGNYNPRALTDQAYTIGYRQAMRTVLRLLRATNEEINEIQ